MPGRSKPQRGNGWLNWPGMDDWRFFSISCFLPHALSSLSSPAASPAAVLSDGKQEASKLVTLLSRITGAPSTDTSCTLLTTEEQKHQAAGFTGLFDSRLSSSTFVITWMEVWTPCISTFFTPQTTGSYSAVCQQLSGTQMYQRGRKDSKPAKQTQSISESLKWKLLQRRRRKQEGGKLSKDFPRTQIF